jgi:hypothetical protein
MANSNVDMANSNVENESMELSDVEIVETIDSKDRIEEILEMVIANASRPNPRVTNNYWVFCLKTFLIKMMKLLLVLLLMD